MRCMAARAMPRTAAQSTRGRPSSFSSLKAMFSATVRLGNRDRSW